MPRKSAAALSVVAPLNARERRLTPPDGLSEPARLLFVEVVSANAPTHFTRADMPLLVAYTTACTMERQAAEALEGEGPIVAGRANPWLVVQEKSVRAMVALAMRLRLAPQSRFDTRAAGRSANKRGPRGIEALTGIGGNDDGDEA